MPALRTSARRKSSHTLFSPAKPGFYGVPSRPVTFAPNVTPITFNEEVDEDVSVLASSSNPNVQALTAKLFPPSETPALPPSRKRCPPGKRRSQGYIPRPPNAFMLFRADFVRQKHVPGSLETNHGSLSKIIGTCWKQLPLEEKKVWEVKAKHEKAAHKQKYPDYRFRPVHNKNKHIEGKLTDKKEKQIISPEDERRVEEVAQLLLEGKKGEELARAVRSLDRARSMENDYIGIDDYEQGTRPPSTESFAMPMPSTSLQLPYVSNSYGAAPHRRPSSVPLPNEWFAFSNNAITLPAVPSFNTRPVTPVGSISRYTQANQAFEQFTTPFYPQYTPTGAEFPQLVAPQPSPSFFNTSFMTSSRSSFGLRRASSAQPFHRRSWTIPTFFGDFSGVDFGTQGGMMDRDPSPLPEVNPQFFSNFSFDGSSSSPVDSISKALSTSGDDQVGPSVPLESVAPHEQHIPSPSLSRIDTTFPPEFSFDDLTSGPSSMSDSSSSTGSPAPSIRDILPEENSITSKNTLSGTSFDMNVYMNLESLYAHDMSIMDIGMGAFGGYDVDPVVSSQ